MVSTDEGGGGGGGGLSKSSCAGAMDTKRVRIDERVL